MNTNIIAFNSRRINKSNIWLTFIFLGWSYGSMNQMIKQLFYYLTLGGLGLWTIYRLFTLNSKIDEYNYNVAIELGLSDRDMKMFGIYHPKPQSSSNKSSSKQITKSLLTALVVISVVTASIVLHSTYIDIKNSEKSVNKIDSIVVRSLEKAYFEGQKDYMNGDVRRKINGKDTTYTILKSFWDNGNPMVFKL